VGNDSDFVRHVCELLAPVGQVTTRRMFGGHGVYADGLFVAIIAWDELYLKVDDTTRAAFEQEGCEPFAYDKAGKTMTMSYYRAPGEAMDAPHLMTPWARRAMQAALRARALKPALKKKVTAKKKSIRLKRKAGK
jgi:DNA transformation protein